MLQESFEHSAPPLSPVLSAGGGARHHRLECPAPCIVRHLVATSCYAYLPARPAGAAAAGATPSVRNAWLQLISEWDSKEDFVNSLLTSCHMCVRDVAPGRRGGPATAWAARLGRCLLLHLVPAWS